LRSVTTPRFRRPDLDPGQHVLGRLDLLGQWPEPRVKPVPDLRQHLVADAVDDAEHRQCQYGDQAQHDQGTGAVRRQYAIVDLHHVERRHQCQYIDANAEQHHRERSAAAGGNRPLGFGLGSHGAVPLI
jgi:hypothetical protein